MDEARTLLPAVLQMAKQKFLLGADVKKVACEDEFQSNVCFYCKQDYYIDRQILSRPHGELALGS